MHFASDNWAGVPDAVSRALAEAASGAAPAYGDDGGTAAVTAKIAEIFEHEVAVFYVATGSAANALSLAAFAPPGGVVFAHETAHVMTDECNAPAFLSPGTRYVGVPGHHGRLDAGELAHALDRFGPPNVHHGRAAAVTITNATELGTVYSPADVAAIGEVVHSRGLKLHMDGARLGNALAALGVSPADLTWRDGVDALSFGLTKTGAWSAEAVVLFTPDGVGDLPYLRKRAGHLFSKSRFVSAQFSALLEDGRWLSLAGHANAMARRLHAGLAALPDVAFPFVPEANELFPALPREMVGRLFAAGAAFYEWPDASFGDTAGPERTRVRLVTSFATTEADVDAFLAAARG